MTEGLQHAQDALRSGGLIVYPTDTVYGIGCDATQPAAIQRLREVKDLPAKRGVSVLFATTDEAKAWTRWTPLAQALAHALFPGPVTIILEARDEVPQALLPPEGTLAVRNIHEAPALPLARTCPLVATSANEHGSPASETLEEAKRSFGDAVDAYIDKGRLTGPASTVVDARGKQPTVIREGPFSEEEILEAVNLGG